MDVTLPRLVLSSAAPPRLVRQRRRIPSARPPAMSLSRRRMILPLLVAGQVASEEDGVGPGDGAELLHPMAAEFALQLLPDPRPRLPAFRLFLERLQIRGPRAREVIEPIRSATQQARGEQDVERDPVAWNRRAELHDDS